MKSLMNKRILLGVTGGIAAYKSAEVIRRLQDRGAEVQVVMTPAAQEFITPLTLQALSGHPVHTDLLNPEAEAGMGHIELSRWADLILIAPASADFISKLVVGEGSDLLSTVCLASRSSLAIAPAMNQGMWANEATQNNLEVLARRNIEIWGPASGIQACGDLGFGRMLEPEDLADHAEKLYSIGALQGKRVVITAGPTREAIDPVRYISNHSSGKMGYALAIAAAEAGAETILISGPVHLSAPDRVTMKYVTSAIEMHQAAMESSVGADIFIGAAAVADFRPEQVQDQKIKKGDSDTMSINMVKNPDVIASVAQLENKPFIAGFAAETQQVESYAKTKLERKNLDMIVANDVSNERIGFNSDINEVTVITKQEIVKFDEVNKSQLARDLISFIGRQMNGVS